MIGNNNNRRMENKYLLMVFTNLMIEIYRNLKRITIIRDFVV